MSEPDTRASVVGGFVDRRPQFLTVKGVAHRLGLSIGTVKRIPESELPYYRVTARRDRRYRITDVEAWLDARRVG